MADDGGQGDCSAAAIEIRSDHSDLIDGVDFISSLPDEILQHILFFLLTKTAVRTSILSKRWKNIWSETPSLSIDFDPMTAESINETLTRCTAPKIMSCCLCATSVESEPYIERWIEFAMSRDAEILSLKLCFQDFHKYNFPDIFYINSSVKRLSVDVSFSTELIPRCTVSWTSLNELYLSKCYLSDESIANILSGCPMLQSLTLYMVVDLRYLDLTGSFHLTKLKIVHDPPPTEPLEIVAPHIHYLRLVIPQESCILVDVSSLTKTKFDISYLWKILKPEDIQDMMLKTLEKLLNVKKLTFGPIFLQILSLAEFLGFRFPTLKVEALTLHTMIVRSVVPGIIKLLQNSPELKKLSIHTEECNNLSDDDLIRYLDCQALKPDQWWRSKYGDFPILEGTRILVKMNAEPKVLTSFLDVVNRNTKTLDSFVIVQLGEYLEYGKSL